MNKLSWKEPTTIHQELMNRAYEEYQKHEEWDEYQFIDSLEGTASRDAVILGNLNYQVENGGWDQWWENGYGPRDYQSLIKILSSINTSSSLKVLNLLKRAARILTNKKYNVKLDKLDDMYYEINEQFMEDVDKYLLSFPVDKQFHVSNQAWDVFDSQMDEPEDRNFTNEMDDVKLRRFNPPRYDKRKDWYQSLNEKGNDSDVSNRYEQTSLTSRGSRKFNCTKVAVSFDQWLYGKSKNLQTFVKEYTRLLTEVDPNTQVDIVDGGVASLQIYVETHGDPDYSIYDSLLKKYSLKDELDEEKTDYTNYKFKDPIEITKKDLDNWKVKEQKRYSKWRQTLSELDPPPGFIPTNEGMMTEEDIFDYLDYSSYRANRNYDKFLEPCSNVPNPDYDFEKSRLKWRNFWLNHGGWSEEKLDRFERRYSRENRESNTSIEYND